MKQNRTFTNEGETFSVPCHIARVEAGWQVRYEVRSFGPASFADQKCGGTGKAMREALVELEKRYRQLPPKPTSSVSGHPLSHKQNDLPAGISGPVMMARKNRAVYAEFKVTLPVLGGKNRGTSVYIATEATWSQEKYDQALGRAVRIRDEAVRNFRGSQTELRSSSWRATPCHFEKLASEIAAATPNDLKGKA